MSTLEELEALSKLIQDNIANIKASTTANNAEFPSVHSPLSIDSEAVRMMPEVDKSCSLIVSAASQLISVVRSPMLSIVAAAMQFQVPAALGVVITANVAEACREAGSKGAHVQDIARASNVDPVKLARVLRVLATNHIFEEISPDVFTNNRISSVLDTGKSVKTLLESPKTKYVGTNGISAGVGHCADEGMKSAAFIQETLFDPKFSMSQEPNESALNVAFKTQLPIFEWFEAQGNEHRLARFAVTMEGSKQAAPPDAILQGFDWGGLPKDSLIVDVGGSIGTHSFTIAQQFSHLRFVVQDRDQVIEDAKEFWNRNMPSAIESGQVVLQAHDFFKPQPIKDAAVFLLRQILHDWPDKYCLQILRHLRSSASPSTYLILVDNLLAYACVDNELKSVPGAETPPPPAPLLANGGTASIVPYFQDMLMMEFANGRERTLTQIRELLEQTGWNLIQVHQGSTFNTSKAIAIPA